MAKKAVKKNEKKGEVKKEGKVTKFGVEVSPKYTKDPEAPKFQAR